MDATDFRNDVFTFLEQNVVIVAITADDVKNVVYDRETATVVRPGKDFVVKATVIPISGATVSGCDGGAFYLRKAADSVADTEKRTIFFVPYAQNKLCGTILGNQAQWVFTATMDGCSFGIGSQPGDGTVMVVHANASRSAGGGGGRDQQVRMQARLLESTFSVRQDALSGVIGPSSYMVEPGGQDSVGTNRLRSTTFGRRVHGRWQFYTLRYRVSGGAMAPHYDHEGVHPAP